MAQHDTGENILFPRGMTASGFFGTPAVALNSTAPLDFEDWVGVERDFPDFDYSVKPAQLRSGATVRCRIMRNTSGVILYPKRLVTCDTFVGTAGPKGLAKAPGYTRLPNVPGVVVDEWLPAGGVPLNDLFWAVISGPTIIINQDTAGVAITVGGLVTSQTAANSTGGATILGAGGKIQGLTYTTITTASGVTTLEGLQNAIGMALSASASSSTNASVLVNVYHYN